MQKYKVIDTSRWYADDTVPASVRYRVTCRNKKTGETFQKGFSSPFFAEKFIKKSAYSKKIDII